MKLRCGTLIINDDFVITATTVYSRNLPLLLNYIKIQNIMTPYSFKSEILTSQPIVSEKDARRLIGCNLKMTVFTRFAFIFSESSYFNLKFGKAIQNWMKVHRAMADKS